MTLLRFDASDGWVWSGPCLPQCICTRRGLSLCFGDTVGEIPSVSLWKGIKTPHLEDLSPMGGMPGKATATAHLGRCRRTHKTRPWNGDSEHDFWSQGQIFTSCAILGSYSTSLSLCILIHKARIVRKQMVPVRYEEQMR